MNTVSCDFLRRMRLFVRLKNGFFSLQNINKRVQGQRQDIIPQGLDKKTNYLTRQGKVNEGNTLREKENTALFLDLVGRIYEGILQKKVSKDIFVR